jgi:hypothetical protein
LALCVAARKFDNVMAIAHTCKGHACGFKLLFREDQGMIGTFAWVSFPFGILIGYLWRDRISKARAARYWAGHKKRHPFGAAAGDSTVRR